MAHKVTKITTLIGSVLVSTTALAAPKPFDEDLAAELANNPSYPIPQDEDVVLRYIASCVAADRICREESLRLNAQGRIDATGPVDLIIGANEVAAHKRFYSGRSDGLFAPAETFGVVGPTSGMKLADLDNDGDLDMVETMRGGCSNGCLPTHTNYVYVNRNGTMRSLFDDEQALDSTKDDRSSGVVIGDVNGDNKLDVVISNETTGGHEVTAPNQTNYLYLNTTTVANTVTFAPAIALDPPGTEKYTRRMLLIDVEGDGDLDLVATAANTSADETGVGNLLYVNSGATTGNPFAAAVPLNANTDDDTDVANAIAAGDLDGDGDPDLVFSTWSRGGASASPATNRYYINSSTPGNINFETTGTINGSGHHTNVRLADFDNDGDRDLVTTVFEGRNVLHRNVGAPTYFDTGFQLVEPTGLAVDLSRGVDFADLNGDQSLDLVIANRTQLGLRYLNNDKCSPAGCGAFTGPFQNATPSISGQGTAVIPPATTPITPIDVNALLDAFTVTDSDNVYSADFTAVVAQPSSEYTCTDGIIASGPISGTCRNGRITPNAGAYANNTIGPFDLKVRDGESSSGSFSATLTVGTGSAPAFTTSTTLPSAAEDGLPLYTTTIAATDNDGDALEFEPENPLPTWLALSTGGVLSATSPPQQGDVGSHTISVRVTDSTDLFAVSAFTLTVTNVNDKPSVTTTTLPNGNQGQAYSTTVTASDEDGTTPTFVTPNNTLPTGLTLSAAGGISGTPTISGTFQVVLTATDGVLASTPVTLPLTIVAAPGTNASPVITAPGPQTAAVGTAFSLTVAATDADSDALTFAATGLPTGFTMSPAGVIAGTATDTTGSPFTVTVNVSDGKGGSDSETFQLTVSPQGNRAPVFTAPGPQSGTVGTAFNLSLAGSATDADGDSLTFAATGLPPGIGLSTAGLLSGSPTTASGSPFTVAVTVSDGKGGTTSGSFQFTVSNPTSGGGGGDSGGGGGSFGFLEVLALFGMGALATRRRRLAASR